MVTLVFSYYVVAYLLLPAGLFRWFTSLFIALKNFQRTKTQEITFAAGTSLVPFLLAWIVAWNGYIPHIIPVNQTWSDRRADYKMVYAGIVEEKTHASPGFWQAVTRCGRRQADFLFFFYYPLVLIEARGFVFLVKKYGKWKGHWFYKFIARRLLLPHLSEWEMLLTPFNFPPKPRLEVWLDVLTSDNVLYRGVLGDRFLDSNGVLTGIILAPRLEHSPKRFDREKYKRASEVRSYSTQPQNYWREIPSGAFYISSDKILNMNVSYVEADPLDTVRTAMSELEKQGVYYEIKQLSETAHSPTSDESLSEDEDAE